MTELNRIRPWLALLSGATVLLLAWFHASLWFGQGGGGEDSWRMAGMAVLSDLAKVLLFSAGVWLTLSRAAAPRLVGLAMVLVSFALVTLSVTAVFGALQVSGAKSAPIDAEQVARADLLVNVYRDQVAQLTAAGAAMPTSWVTKRAQAADSLTAAVAGLTQAVNARNALDHTVAPGAAYFSGLGIALGTSTASAQQTIYLAYSLLLELVSLLSTLVALFGDRLAGVGAKLAEVGGSPEPARNPPSLAESATPTTAKVIQRKDLPDRAKMRQVMRRFVDVAFAGIEAGQGDAFLGRNKIMNQSGLDRTAVDWCQRQLVLRHLVETAQNPQRTIPKATKEAMMRNLFPELEGV